MNQNSVKIRWPYYVGLMIFIFSFFALVYKDAYQIAVDVQWVYLPCFRGEVAITDWHSSLFMYEGRILTNLLGIAGVENPSFRALRIFWIVSETVIFLSIYIWIKKLSMYNMLFSLLFPLYALAMLIFRQMAYFQYMFSIDLYFIALLLVAITSPLFFSRIRRSKTNDLIIFLISSCIFLHLLSFRKNAILLIPFLVTYSVMMRYPQLPTRKLIYSFFVTSLLLPFFYATNHLLPARHTHPAIPMVVSDLKISAILRGEEDVNRRILKRIGLRYKPHEETICPLSGVPGTFDALGKYDALTAKEQWESLKSYYFESIKKHPKTMMIAKLIQIVQFCSDWYVPMGLRNLLHHHYGTCPPNSPLWESRFSTKETRITYERIVVYLLTLIALLFSIRSWHRDGRSLPLVISLATGGAAIIYFLSFLPVTPTPDFRYHSPSMLLGVFSILCTALYYIESYIRGIRNNSSLLN